MNELSFASEFPPANHDDWIAAVNKILRRGARDPESVDLAAQFETVLVNTSADGFDVQPLYTRNNAPADQAAPGKPPFVRASNAAPRPWEIRQRVWPGNDDSSAVHELESGATGIWLQLGAGYSRDTIETALTGVLLDLAPVSLATPADDDGTGAAAALLTLWDSGAVPTADRNGSLGVDPIGAFARTGGVSDLERGFTQAAELVSRAAAQAPNAQLLVADGTVFHDAGATPAQELGWGIATAAAIVRAVADHGVPAATAAAAIEFRWAGTADQFTTIAKLRAARRLWARVLAASDLPVAAGVHHVDGSSAMMTRYDPWVNALRSTVACFAAAVGGADAITVQPHDARLHDGGTALGRRLARNTQTVLQMESNLARVVDMSGGSWYVEWLTDQLAQTAWQQVRITERDGGVIASLRDGNIGRAIEDAVSERDGHVATRQRPLTGLTEFPNIDEQPPPAVKVAAPPTNTVFAPLTRQGIGAAFEAQRQRTDRHTIRHGERPTVVIATIGNPADFTARATYAKNFFETAGIRTVSQPHDEIDDQPKVVCVCSSNAIYSERGRDVIAALRSAGAEHVYLAGRGLNIDGVDIEIGHGSNVLTTTAETLDQLGVDQNGDHR